MFNQFGGRKPQPFPVPANDNAPKPEVSNGDQQSAMGVMPMLLIIASLVVWALAQIAF